MTFAWPDGAVAAVSLAFDGSQPRCLEVRDALMAAGVRSTFYEDAPSILADMPGWRRASESGHEIGNHALLGATDADGLIARLTPEAVEEEIRDLHRLLAEDLGVAPRTAALPLVRTWTDADGLPSIPEVVRRTIVRMNEETAFGPMHRCYGAVRVPEGRFHQPGDPLGRIPTCRIDDLDAVSAGLIAQIAISQRAWIVLSANDPDPDAILQLTRWLKGQPVWIAPVGDVVDHLRESFRRSETFQSV